MKKIHVGILISYDYQYAQTCIRQIYNHADRITLAIDVNRRTWNGEKYAMSEDFLKGIKASDPERKIHIYEDDFSIPGLSAMENDTRERNMLAERMGSAEDQWHIQVDSDEYFVDFGAFVSFLHAIEKKVHKPLSVWVEWVTLLKKDPDGFLYVDNASRKEMAVVATNDPHYTAARLNTSLKITNLYCNHRLLHQSWARPETEIYQKIHNWSHNTDVDAEGYFNFWKSTNRHNAPFLRDFHPFPQCRATWHTLKFIPGDIDDIIASLRNDYHPSNKLAPKQYIKAVVKRVLRQLHIRRNPV